MINNIKTFGKFLDQPLLISKLNKAMPMILLGGASVSAGKNAYDVFVKNKTDNKEELKENKIKFHKNTAILFASCIGALCAPKIASKIIKRDLIPSVSDVVKNNCNLIDDFISKNDLDEQTLEILNKAKSKVLSFSEIKSLINNLKVNLKSDFIDKLIPDPQNVSSKDIFSEIGYLSLYGAIPVVSGVASGIVVDKFGADTKAKTSTCDKISEGLYQYLANIFLCNVGAGCALGILEKLGIDNKALRAASMVTGIILTGVVGGNKIANLISQKIVSPICRTEIKERKPEIVDLGMHTDDIATVATLSGLKWIEPCLPFLYALSGFKSGIGYRN